MAGAEHEQGGNVRLKKVAASGVLLALLAVASATAQPFERQVAPFPVRDAAGAAYAFPLLGGLNQPRPQFVDIDADDDLDLFVQERSGRVMFFENTGTPQDDAFTWRTDYYRGLDVGAWFRFADLDADGDLDLLANQPNNHIRYYRNDGTPADPAFTLAADTLEDASGQPIFSDRQNIPALPALDCQGPPDLFIGRTNGRVTFYEHAGLDASGVPQFQFVSDNFQNICIGPSSICGIQQAARKRHGANAVTAADVDADGDPDLLWGDFFSESLYLIENQGTCDARQLERVSDVFPRQNPLRTSGYNAPQMADLDADGDLDLFAGVLNNGGRDAVGNFYFLENQGEGRFERRTRRFLYAVDIGTESVPALADLDGDGDQDLVLGNSANPGDSQSARLSLFENQGTAAAPSFQQIAAPFAEVASGFNYAPTFTDIDADGDADLFVGTFSGEVGFYRNEGTADALSFSAADTAYVALPRGNYATPAFTDIDADGDQDLFVGESRGNLNFYRNEGTPAAPDFALVTETYADIEADTRSHPAFADVDQDGDADLVLGAGDGVRFYRNTGTPEQARFEAEDGVFDVSAPKWAAPVLVDLERDGDQDLLVGSDAGGLFYYENARVSTAVTTPKAPRSPVTVTSQPNPFRRATTLHFRLARPAHVQLTVHDVLGREVAVLLSGCLSAGAQRVRFEASDVPSGVYLYRLTVEGEQQATGTMLHVR